MISNTACVAGSIDRVVDRRRGHASCLAHYEGVARPASSHRRQPQGGWYEFTAFAYPDRMRHGFVGLLRRLRPHRPQPGVRRRQISSRSGDADAQRWHAGWGSRRSPATPPWSVTTASRCIPPASGGDHWVQRATLTASDRTPGFGRSVAVDARTIVVGAESAPSCSSHPGNGWHEVTKLTGDTNAGRFADRVAVSGATVVVGAPYAVSFPPGGPGIAYVFERDEGGAMCGRSRQIDGAPSLPGMFDAFGNSVAIVWIPYRRSHVATRPRWVCVELVRVRVFPRRGWAERVGHGCRARLA